MNERCTLFAAAVVVFGAAAVCHAGGLNINVDVGVPLAVPAPPPVYVPAPVPQVVLPTTPPQFVYVPDLGYYVAVGYPYDIAYIGRYYYLCSNGYWYRSPYYGGPWRMAAVRTLPPLLVRHGLGEIRHFRDLEFQRYARDREHYRGQWHRPEVRREERREERWSR